MDIRGIVDIGGTLLAAVVLGEALALSGLAPHGVRMGSEWISPENIFLLVSDYVLAGLLLYLIHFTDSILAICFALGALGLTHLFRCVQKRVGMPRPFCASRLMTWLNMSKLVLTVIIWGICLASKGIPSI